MRYCTIEQCGRKFKAIGLCDYHYNKSRRTPTYNAFFQSKNRCTNPNNERYKDYGGRGIKMCDRWSGVDGYKNFLEDMGERPQGMTLDRKDNEGNYEPDNCRWTTYQEQSLNKRAYKSNRSGVKGVYRSKGSWVAYIRVKTKGHHLGCFRNKEEAIKARLEAELNRDTMAQITKA